jgi:isopenicillin N synthase-like dioxygenase
MQMLPWPQHDGFMQEARSLFQDMDAEARKCLVSVAKGLQIQEDKLLKLCDAAIAEKLPLQETSTSFMHLFMYNALGSGAEQCVPHTDSGLVTIIPHATNPGLELLSWATGQWVAVEKIKNVIENNNLNDNIIVVLIGETLSRLTCTHLQATVHRVSSNDSGVRYSIPFQLRASVHAVLDCVSLNCPLFTVPTHFAKPIRVMDFIA